MAVNRQTEVRQVVEVNGRTYEVFATAIDDDRIRMEVLSADPDGEIISQLTGVVSFDDLDATITVVNRLLTAAAVLCLDNVPARTPDAAAQGSEEQYPNAGRRWEPVDDELLVTRYNAGTSIRELAKVFGRKPGGIRSRLVKHGLIEIAESNLTGMGTQEVHPAEPTVRSGHQGHPND